MPRSTDQSVTVVAVTVVADEPDDVSVAPESGQPPGGPEDPWQGEEADSSRSFPPPHHASPKDEL